MRSSSRICLSVVTILVLLTTTAIYLSAPKGHPQFGDVHHSSAAKEGKAARIVGWIDRHSPIRWRLSRYAYAQRTGFQSLPLLTLETNQLYWSLNSGPAKTGWLAFTVPFSTNGVWEFALCGRSNLLDVRQEDLNVAFVALGDPQGPTAFGTNWAQQ